MDGPRRRARYRLDRLPDGCFVAVADHRGLDVGGRRRARARARLARRLLVASAAVPPARRSGPAWNWSTSRTGIRPHPDTHTLVSMERPAPVRIYVGHPH